MPCANTVPRLVAVLLLTAGALVGCGSGSGSPTGPSANPTGSGSMPGVVRWSFDGQTWRASGAPPECPSPLIFTAPADLAQATSVLYPGQIRGGDFKPHGGLRFDAPGQTGAVRVVAPMDGTIYRGARYLGGGEVQHMFDFVNDCGIMHRFDHLFDLAPVLRQIADTLPPPVEGDSRTTLVASGQTVRAGEVLATSIGFPVAGNFFFDWGVYDLRRRNAASENPAWLATHPGEFAPYAICWLDYLAPADAAVVRSLPAGSSESGAFSEYCR